MANDLKNCWEIKGCGREKGGAKESQLGTCVAYTEGLGHSCWAIAGTLCGGVVQGTFAEKEHNCIKCEVYKLYSRISGTESANVKQRFPDEEKKMRTLLYDRAMKK